VEKYEKIIDLPHHVSKKRPRMSISDRAAQFAPYSALSGYEDAVEETARLTDKKAELCEDEIAKINATLTRLAEAPVGIKARITFFRKDEKKKGGAYITVCAEVGDIDPVAGRITLIGVCPIRFSDITEIYEVEEEKEEF
jgi:hypothetical protein